MKWGSSMHWDIKHASFYKILLEFLKERKHLGVSHRWGYNIKVYPEGAVRTRFNWLSMS
jgi:hypothetical protein